MHQHYGSLPARLNLQASHNVSDPGDTSRTVSQSVQEIPILPENQAIWSLCMCHISRLSRSMHTHS